MTLVKLENMKKGKLYIVPTPIGNLGDLTFRAVEILRKAKIIGAEDTRNSAKLMKHYQIDTPLFSYHKFNERKRVDKILEHLQNGEDVAIVSDAGTPGISDPAELIIREVLNQGLIVETLPGATAFIPALVASGLDCKRFFFAGFLPEKESEKKLLLENIAILNATLIFYEAPHRLRKTIEFFREKLGNRKTVIVRELTKIYETFYRADLNSFLENFEQITLKGEFVILIEGYLPCAITDAEILKLLRLEITSGFTKKEAVKKVVQKTNESKNRVYALALQLNLIDE